jgi:hypothetical protein
MGFLADQWKEAGPVKKGAMIAGAAALAQGTVVPALGLAATVPLHAAGQSPLGLKTASKLSKRFAGRGKAGELLGRFGRSAALYVPNKFEREYRKQVMAEAQRLKGAKGGFTEGQLQRALATGRGVVQSAAQERLSQLARGGSIGAGQSGVQAQQQRDLTKDIMGQQRAVAAAVRQQDVEKLERDQAALEKKMLQARNLEYQRRQLAVQALQPAPSAAQQKGMLREMVDVAKTAAGEKGTTLLTTGVSP